MDNLNHMSLPVHFSIDETFNSDKFIKVRLDFAHDGINPNHTRFTKELLEKKKDSLFLSPLLGHIIQNEEGDYEFGGHDMEFRPNPFQDNKMQMFYLETILGIIPPKEVANFEIREVDGLNRVFVDGYIYKKYSNFAEDILRQYDENPISMEIDIFQYSYSVKEDIYDILDFNYTGITFLNQECGTGMLNANSKFFANTENLKSQMVIALQELKSVFEADNKTIEEGGENKIMEDTQVMEAVVEQATEEAGTVATENFEEAPVNETPSEDFVEGEGVQSETNEIVEEVAKEANESFSEVEQEVPAVEPESKFVKTFELSHDGIRAGLYGLLAVQEQSDDDCYIIDEVFDSYFDYYACKKKKCYRQGYVKDNEAVAFSGDRIEIFIEKLTPDEKAALNVLRANYEAQTEELNSLRQFKAEFDLAEKKSEMDKWESKIGSTAEFKALKENFEQKTLDEIKVECKCIFADNNAFTGNVATFSKKKEANEFAPVSFSLSENKETVNNVYNGFFEEFLNK